MTQNLKSNTKMTCFSKTFICHIHPKSSNYIRKYHYFFSFFFLKMSVLLIHPHLPHLFYNIAIVIKTPTTMNNKFQALNAPKINIYIFISSFFTHTLFSFQFISYFIQILIHDKTFEDFSKTSL